MTNKKIMNTLKAIESTRKILAWHRNKGSLLDIEEWEAIDIYNKLRRCECKASRILVNYCNGIIDDEATDKKLAKIENRVDKIFNGFLPLGFKINRDPRGYALKISIEELGNVDKFRLLDEGGYIHQDMGGYIILAPEI